MTDQLRRDGGAVVAPDPGAARGPRLVVPEGWVIDEIARDRLLRQLDRAPAHVAGVMAEVSGLSPGASYRVHAEWRALEAPSAAVEQGTTSVRGAVLTRPGVEFQVRGDIVDVGGAMLLVDPGANVHDPWGSVGRLEVASPYGRPPFPRRPVVVFVGDEADEDLADWARRLVNRLVRRDVEARLALPEVAEGLHLTRPCLPREESIRALAPDVVVALDEVAAAKVPSWCGADRSTVVVELDHDVSMTTQLVSWQIGHASGRLRARISRRVDAPRLAELVRRLCAGPHPMPPVDGVAQEPTRVAVRGPTEDRARTHATRSAVVVTGSPDTSASRRVEGLCDQLAAAGVVVTRAPLDAAVPVVAQTADLLMLAGVHGSEAFHELVDARRGAGRATVVDLTPEDLSFDATVVDAPSSFSSRIEDLVTACGLATSPVGATHAALRRLGVQSQVLPTLLSRTRAASLQKARTIAGFEPRSELVIGWHVGSVRTPAPTYLDAVADGLTIVLTDLPEACVEVIGDRERVPSALRGQDRVSIASDELGPDRLTRWAIHLWAPPIRAGEVVDDPGSMVEVGCAGVPSVLPLASRSSIDGHVSAELMVADPERPEEWATALRVLLDDPQLRAQRSRETFRKSSTIDGSVASKAVVNRFLGWALHGAAA